ncbi:hypothetical protein MTQ74_24325, partial [Escherichia coli]|nr:hypothetical protein [Escherichia coli]
IICSPMTSLKTSIKTITYLSDTGCLEIQGASLASLGTSLFGIMVDHIGWHGGFYLLGCGIICCIIFCWLSHRGAIELERHRAAYIKEH